MDKAKKPSPTASRMTSNMASPCDARVGVKSIEPSRAHDDLEVAGDVAHLRI
jgi:hypothetical protein